MIDAHGILPGDMLVDLINGSRRQREPAVGAGCFKTCLILKLAIAAVDGDPAEIRTVVFL